MSKAWKTIILGSLAMMAFAGNSILNRLALADGEMGAWSFTLIRLVSGAVMLAVLSGFRLRGGSWRAAAMLWLYAAGFSFAYLTLGAGLGALILFAVVQFTMMGQGLLSGERMTAWQWLGSIVAFASMVWLLSPDAEAPPLWAVAAMSAAGFGWGVYSLLGRGTHEPLIATTGNFIRAAIMTLAISPVVFIAMPEVWPAQKAVLAAITSGAITSGVGYAIWYAVLPGLSRMQAGIMQLSVPALAAVGGVIFLAETVTPQLIIATTLILSGVGVATLSRSK